MNDDITRTLDALKAAHAAELEAVRADLEAERAGVLAQARTIGRLQQDLITAASLLNTAFTGQPLTASWYEETRRITREYGR